MKQTGRRIPCCHLIVALASCSVLTFAHANGIYPDGTGARAKALGGADVAYAADPLGAMAVNPAALGTLTTPELNVGALGGALNGTFNKPGVSHGNLDESLRALPEGAIAYPIPKTPVVIGLSCTPESTLLANWHYEDPPSVPGGVSYGYQQDQSKILTLRTALGAGVKINEQFYFGASFGAVYNQNQLTSPYIFQNLQPGPNGPNNAGANGAKTLLDLNTSGWGWNAQVGFLYKVTPDLQLGVSYESQTDITSTGDASGNPYAQFGTSLPFHYDATVKTKFPQQVKTGLSWKFDPQWRLALQLDWVDWASSFNNLPLTFRNGTNPTVNSVLGSGFQETIPLNWSSEFVYRAGLEYQVTPSLVLRGGYCYGNSPVPNSTLTPMTAAIMEHTLTCGAGYRWKQFEVAAAYQYSFQATRNIGTSGLNSGEYSNSSIQVSAQQFAVTTTYHF